MSTSKKILSMLMTVSILITCFTANVYAKNSPKLEDFDKISISSLEEEDFKVLELQVNQLSDNEYINFVSKYVNNSKDKKALKENLKKIGIELSDISAKKIDENGATTYNDAYLATILNYTSKRSGYSYYYVHADYKLGSSEPKPGTYDVIGIYWDSSKANYYGYSSSDGYSSLKSASQATNGTIVFNFYDGMALYSDTYSCAAMITPTTSGEWINVAADFIHTYRTDNITSQSGSANISYSGTGGVTGSIGFTVTNGTSETQWQIGDSNAFYK